MNTPAVPKRATVMGLGLFGGGLGVTTWLLDAGARVLVTDRRSERELESGLRALAPWLESGQLKVELGGHSARSFVDADVVIANAAIPVPWTNPFLLAARAAGIPVTTEIRWSIEQVAAVRTIGVTGSAGKSTTSAMIDAVLRATGRQALLGGNIGGSLLGDPAVARADWITLELSSAQLWWLSAEAAAWSGVPDLAWRPTIGVLTNLQANHVDWHGTLQHYVQAKSGIVPAEGRLLTCFAHDDPQSDALMALEAPSAWWRAPTPARESSPVSLSVPGAHMTQNAHLALAALRMVAVMDERPLRLPDALRALADFPGLPHRLQLVGTIDGVQCFNDSKSTTPAATLRALDAFPSRGRVHLIVGGYDKRISLESIAALAPELAGLYAVGQVQDQLTMHGGVPCGSVDGAVERALANARSGDILLLSPACASTDQFANFERRGERFVELVLAAGATPCR